MFQKKGKAPRGVRRGFQISDRGTAGQRGGKGRLNLKKKRVRSAWVPTREGHVETVTSELAPLIKISAKVRLAGFSLPRHRLPYTEPEKPRAASPVPAGLLLDREAAPTNFPRR